MQRKNESNSTVINFSNALHNALLFPYKQVTTNQGNKIKPSFKIEINIYPNLYLSFAKGFTRTKSWIRFLL